MFVTNDILGDYCATKMLTDSVGPYSVSPCEGFSTSIYKDSLNKYEFRIGKIRDESDFLPQFFITNIGFNIIENQIEIPIQSYQPQDIFNPPIFSICETVSGIGEINNNIIELNISEYLCDTTFLMERKIKLIKSSNLTKTGIFKDESNNRVNIIAIQDSYLIEFNIESFNSNIYEGNITIPSISGCQTEIQKTNFINKSNNQTSEISGHIEFGPSDICAELFFTNGFGGIEVTNLDLERI